MNNQQKKNQRTILLIFAMTLVPFGFAGFLAKNVDLVSGGQTNYGELVIPPVTTEKNEYIGFDDFSSENMHELSGRWVLAMMLPNQDCNQECTQLIHKTKQLWLMLSKDLTRVRRLAILFHDVDVQKAQAWWQWDCQSLNTITQKYEAVNNCKITVLRSQSDSLTTKFKQAANSPVEEGTLFIIDPLGNIMMRYKPDFDVYKAKGDLRKLLKNSQIG